LELLSISISGLNNNGLRTNNWVQLNLTVDVNLTSTGGGRSIGCGIGAWGRDYRTAEWIGLSQPIRSDIDVATGSIGDTSVFVYSNWSLRNVGG
jgi:hypothetical protein